jgi:hypothetical protein
VKLQNVSSEFTASGIAADIALVGHQMVDADPHIDLTGKVVFVTVQGMAEIPALAPVYLQAGARLAILEVNGWGLHVLSPRAGQERLWMAPPIICASWVQAVERVIERFGPIDLWLDTRAMAWPPVSRIGGIR